MAVRARREADSRGPVLERPGQGDRSWNCHLSGLASRGTREGGTGSTVVDAAVGWPSWTQEGVELGSPQPLWEPRWLQWPT